MERRDIPNLITILRILLVLPIVWLIAHQYYWESLSLFAIAGVSDGVDGFLAKRFGWQSRLGSILDPLADKLLLVSTTVMLAWTGLVPLWLVLAIVLRDLLIVAGGTLYHYRIGIYDMIPSNVSKINTFSQISYLLGVILIEALGVNAATELGVASIVVLTTTLLSGADYAWTWGWDAYRQQQRKRVDG
jgi:cardiolipin synthase